MPAKKKSKTVPARKPRPAPRGMYLTVHVTDRAGCNKNVRISSFHDITALGHEVARAVRGYLRTVPMLPHVPAYSLTVWPHWTPTSSAPARKAEHDGIPHTADSEDEHGG